MGVSGWWVAKTLSREFWGRYRLVTGMFPGWACRGPPSVLPAMPAKPTGRFGLNFAFRYPCVTPAAKIAPIPCGYHN